MQELERQAEESHVDIEEVISKRLVSCVRHTAIKPIYIDDKDRQKIDGILGRNVGSIEDLKKELCKAVSIRVDGVQVKLPQEVRARLASRHLDKKITYEEHIVCIVRKLLQEYVGR